MEYKICKQGLLNVMSGICCQTLKDIRKGREYQETGRFVKFKKNRKSMSSYLTYKQWQDAESFYRGETYNFYMQILTEERDKEINKQVHLETPAYRY